MFNPVFADSVGCNSKEEEECIGKELKLVYFAFSVCPCCMTSIWSFVGLTSTPLDVRNASADETTLALGKSKGVLGN